jgi:class 3 adenylate cyclase/tetratricopeptide (TPR) repeat protein
LDVSAFLARLGLERYATAFQEAEITEDVLAELSETDLQSLGLPLGPRKKILKALREASHQSEDASESFEQRPERRQLTVVFIDLVGSTALAARCDPEVTREVLRLYQDTVAGEISRFGGHVAKFMGDGVLAYFGWPKTYEESAERAVSCALAVSAAVRKLKHPATPEGLLTRSGIATGLVVVGDLIGQGGSEELAVVGETPNLAARLQTVAEPGAVAIAESTRRLVGHLFELRDAGPLSLRGLPEVTSASFVVRSRATMSRFVARQNGQLSALVARQEELALILDRWSQARTGAGQVVLLTGEAGIGKSRIVEALVDSISAEPHHVVRLQCSPYHSESPLYPIIDYLTDLASAAGVPATPIAHDAHALLARIQGQANEGLNDDPQKRRLATLDALIGHLEQLTRAAPLLWIVEDAHWIDPTTLELVETAASRAQNAEILLVVTARLGFSSGLERSPIVTKLALNRLSRKAVHTIVAGVAFGRAVSPRMMDRIADKSDGVPLFAEEMTKAILDLQPGSESREADDPDEIAVPLTLHDILMARLDRLQDTKDIAQLAAVIGRVFDRATLAALSGKSDIDLDLAIRRLVDAELISRGVGDIYQFKHALVRDAAYESILKSRRAALHASLLGLLGQRPGSAPELLAHHAQAAGLLGRALELWEEAGTIALSRPAYQEAITSLSNAIRLCSKPGTDRDGLLREQSLQLKLGEALLASRGTQQAQAMEAFDRALTLAEELGDEPLKLPALYGLWAGHSLSGSGSAAATRELAENYADLAVRMPDTGPHLVGLRMLGLERFREARFTDSLHLVRKALALYEPEKHRLLALRFGHDPRAAAANHEAWCLWHLGFSADAVRVVEANVRWVREIDHAYTTGIALCYANLTNIWLRRTDAALALADETIRLSQATSLPLWSAWARIHRGWALAHSNIGDGVAEIEIGLADSDRIVASGGKGGLFEALHLGLAADVALRAGQPSIASDRIEKALRIVATGIDSFAAVDLYRIRAAISAADGHDEDARADLSRAIGIARHQQSPALELRACRDLLALAPDAVPGQTLSDISQLLATFSDDLLTPDLQETRDLMTNAA